ncbi:phosphatidate cytidylyltransferase [Roseateles koreensis]|uniref:Phosphatidate cytidylyltransferase n=1 Tax=Roseateles koreensis TaxID=2987526 RepID=A0ABT5KL98_9BURK|nr:phosphatidate cytidylyltransferase [Roseateles koreensis]MDC8783679.1 phosphatidate cytidylyltransferase [Roseateles koreensis]
MLKQRVITALVLLAVLLPCLFAASPWPFALLTLLMIAAAGWEWARLNSSAGPVDGASTRAGTAGLMPYGFGIGVAGVCAATLYGLGLQAPPVWCWWLAGLIWVLGGVFALRGGPAAWPHASRPLRLVLGALALWAAWLAMVQAKTLGINFLLSIFCLVWAADVAAYFGGRAFGRRKLAPAISPGKSWEGVWSGMAAVLVLALVWSQVIDRQLAVDSPSLYQLLARQGLFVGVLSVLMLSAMSVVGDLFESLIKRAVGAKDSSQLLPGHGGVLDRVDALLPVFPLAMALSSLSLAA